ncbi:helix-turn-helix domain-containing protein [Granulicatella seriolae]|uniref:XRE family transcriptional regulator n=1 Tax=Granulicatella seriolae TaxID=2967226 RepID=A0ABT1WN48_9LACT|nr:XRE family transcriptional regulator [Granulicatella seriolae]
MEIGKQLKDLRIQKGLTQEELGERTDLTKGYISQLENNLSSPSMETFFDILEVLGCPAKDFFDDEPAQALSVYTPEDMTITQDHKNKTTVKWLNPDSNEHEMEPILLQLEAGGEYKTFQPSLAESFGYVLTGKVEVKVGKQRAIVEAGNAFYFVASAKHQIKNAAKTNSELLLVVTDSYL